MSRTQTFVVLMGTVLALSGCAVAGDEDLDPASTLSGEEWWDEGPPSGPRQVDIDLPR